MDVWESRAFRDEALVWIDRELQRQGRHRTGEVEARVRSWAAVYRVPTDEGAGWFKAEGPGQAFEVALYGVLQRFAPDHVLHPWAVEPDRHWLLLPDGGEILRTVLDENPDRVATAMAAFLPQYAQLQLELMPHVDQLLAAGVVDMSPAMMPQRFDEAVAAARLYVDAVGVGGGEQPSDDGTPGRTAEEVEEVYVRVLTRRDHYVEQCARLAAGPVPVSIQHDDLHHGNVFVTAPGEQTRFFDWGDAVVAHPFATLLVTLRVLCEQVHVETDHPVVRHVRDTYLEVFADYAPHDELVALLENACDVAKVTRSLTWVRELATMPPEQATRWAPGVLGWLELLTVDDYLGNVARAD